MKDTKGWKRPSQWRGNSVASLDQQKPSSRGSTGFKRSSQLNGNSSTSDHDKPHLMQQGSINGLIKGPFQASLEERRPFCTMQEKEGKRTNGLPKIAQVSKTPTSRRSNPCHSSNSLPKMPQVSTIPNSRRNNHFHSSNDLPKLPQVSTVPTSRRSRPSNCSSDGSLPKMAQVSTTPDSIYSNGLSNTAVSISVSGNYSIPFKWEEAPGKAKPCCITVEPQHSSLQLPPKLQTVSQHQSYHSSPIHKPPCKSQSKSQKLIKIAKSIRRPASFNHTRRHVQPSFDGQASPLDDHGGGREIRVQCLVKDCNLNGRESRDLILLDGRASFWQRPNTASLREGDRGQLLRQDPWPAEEQSEDEVMKLDVWNLKIFKHKRVRVHDYESLGEELGLWQFPIPSYKKQTEEDHLYVDKDSHVRMRDEEAMRSGNLTGMIISCPNMIDIEKHVHDDGADDHDHDHNHDDDVEHVKDSGIGHANHDLDDAEGTCTLRDHEKEGITSERWLIPIAASSERANYQQPQMLSNDKTDHQSNWCLDLSPETDADPDHDDNNNHDGLNDGHHHHKSISDATSKHIRRSKDAFKNLVWKVIRRRKQAAAEMWSPTLATYLYNAKQRDGAEHLDSEAEDHINFRSSPDCNPYNWSESNHHDGNHIDDRFGGLREKLMELVMSSPNLNGTSNISDRLSISSMSDHHYQYDQYPHDHQEAFYTADSCHKGMILTDSPSLSTMRSSTCLPGGKQQVIIRFPCNNKSFSNVRKTFRVMAQNSWQKFKISLVDIQIKALRATLKSL